MLDLFWLREVLEPLEAEWPQDCCVFVGGSTARGWGTPRSDVDVYVLGSEHDRGVTLPTVEEGRPRVDVHEVSSARLEALFDKVSWEVVQAGTDFVDQLRVRDWLLLERLKHALPLRGEAALEELRARLANTAHTHMLLQQHFTYADSYAEDAVGFLEAGDVDSAALAAQTAYLRAVDGLLVASGCYAWVAKWRSRAVRDTAPPHVSYADYWSIATMANLARDGAAAWAELRVREARLLMSRVDVLTGEVVA
jgi:predicted nucleotidyltransferase